MTDFCQIRLLLIKFSFLIPFFGITLYQCILKNVIRNCSMELIADLALRMFLKAFVCCIILRLSVRKRRRHSSDLNTKDIVLLLKTGPGAMCYIFICSLTRIFEHLSPRDSGCWGCGGEQHRQGLGGVGGGTDNSR